MVVLTLLGVSETHRSQGVCALCGQLDISRTLHRQYRRVNINIACAFDFALRQGVYYAHGGARKRAPQRTTRARERLTLQNKGNPTNPHSVPPERKPFSRSMSRAANIGTCKENRREEHEPPATTNEILKADASTDEQTRTPPIG